MYYKFLNKKSMRKKRASWSSVKGSFAKRIHPSTTKRSQRNRLFVKRALKRDTQLPTPKRILLFLVSSWHARRTPAVGAVRQVIAKFSRKHISSETATADRNNAVSARREDGRDKCASWSIVENSLSRKTYPKSTNSTQV